MTTFFDYHAPQPTYTNASIYRDIASMKRGMTKRTKPQMREDSGSTLQKIASFASLTRIFGKRKEADEAKASSKPKRTVRWEDEGASWLQPDGSNVSYDTSTSLPCDYGSLERTQRNDEQASAEGPRVQRKITRWEPTGRSNANEDELSTTSDVVKDDRKQGSTDGCT